MTERTDWFSYTLRNTRGCGQMECMRAKRKIVSTYRRPRSAATTSTEVPALDMHVLIHVLCVCLHVKMLYVPHHIISHHDMYITLVHRGGTSFKTQAKILHRCAFGVPMNLVSAYITDEDTGLPVSHGVVERCYGRFLACVQLYVRERQEDSQADT